MNNYSPVPMRYKCHNKIIDFESKCHHESNLAPTLHITERIFLWSVYFGVVCSLGFFWCGDYLAY